MKIKKFTENKSDLMEILLIGDEDERMIAKYLDKSTIFAVYEQENLISACAVMKIDNETVEIKNIATFQAYQNKGYASILLDFVCKTYKKDFKFIILGTGENRHTLSFYKKRGFVETHRIKNFFINNYSHPIFEDGKQLTDMIYLKKSL